MKSGDAVAGRDAGRSAASRPAPPPRRASADRSACGRRRDRRRGSESARAATSRLNHSDVSGATRSAAAAAARPRSGGGRRGVRARMATPRRSVAGKEAWYSDAGPPLPRHLPEGGGFGGASLSARAGACARSPWGTRRGCGSAPLRTSRRGDIAGEEAAAELRARLGRGRRLGLTIGVGQHARDARCPLPSSRRPACHRLAARSRRRSFRPHHRRPSAPAVRAAGSAPRWRHRAHPALPSPQNESPERRRQ